MKIGKEIGIIILCGGESSRMNLPKAFLEIEGITLLEKITNIYCSAKFLNPVIVLNHKFFVKPWLDTINKLSIKSVVLKNQFPDLGRAHSIRLGLYLKKDKTFCFIQNIDNPDISIDLLNKMIAARDEEGYVVPMNNGISGHPILIGKKIIEHLAGLKSSTWVLKDELKKFKRITIDAPDNNVLLNLNTEKDWEKYCEEVKSKK